MSSPAGRLLVDAIAIVAPFLPIAFASLAGVRWWLGLPAMVGAFVLVAVVRMPFRALFQAGVQFALAVCLVALALAIRLGGVALRSGGRGRD